MPTLAFLTIDTELAWRHHAARLPVDQIYARSIEPAGVGLGYQLAMLRRYQLKACFFVDPMPAMRFGIDWLRRVVEAVQAAGQEVQLHIHPVWDAAVADLARHRGNAGHLHAYSRETQHRLISTARDLLMEAGARAPIAFRAGSYAANDDTLAVLAELGFRYDSSHNGADPARSRIALPGSQIAPILRQVLEVPVTVIEDRPGRLRPLQLCAVSTGEMKAALRHARAEGHAALTIVSHSFELADRAGVRKNRVHVRRFERLCRLLAEYREELPTSFFADAPRLAETADRPLGSDRMRTHRRRIEQAWSNVVEERWSVRRSLRAIAAARKDR